MDTILRVAPGLLVLMLLVPMPARAQQLTAGSDAGAYATERTLIESTLETIVAVLQEAALRQEGHGLTDRLGRLSDQLTRAARLVDPSPTPAAASQDDLEDLAELLDDLLDDLDDLREELADDGEHRLARRLGDLHQDLRRAAREADRLASASDRRVTLRDGERWLRPGRHGDDDRERIRKRRAEEMRTRERRHEHRSDDDDDDGWDDRDWDDDDDDGWRDRHRDDWLRYDHRDWWGGAGTVVGAFNNRWPYRNEIALNRPVPAIRYNRVEGFVLGLGVDPLRWTDRGRLRPFGQAGYAFALDEWRYEAGGELRLDGARRADFGLKVGGSYYHNTFSRDTWKTSWLENSLAAFFFEYDFFDYYDVEGWQLYAVQRLTPLVQLGVGYRQDDYRSLEKQTGWSVFEGEGFAFNPAIDEGRMQSVVITAEGGRVRNLRELPRGAAFRTELEIGEGLGGDFDFTRFVGDARVYLPVAHFSSLALRLRGGVLDGGAVPVQKAFTLGGVGSVRAYPQNAFLGTRMLLGNAEYIVDDVRVFDDVLEDLSVFGFFDAGWVNAFETDDFSFDDVLPTAGFGLGFGDRTLRLELAFPLRDVGTGRDPSLWVRLTPTF